MLSMLARNWWVLALRGLVAILFGVLAFIWPQITLTVLVLMFGAYALVDGVLAVIAGISQRGESERWWALLLEGLVGILAGITVFVWPGVTTFVLLYMIAAWAIVTGVLEIAAAIRLRKEIEGELLLFLTGLLSVLFGVALIVAPGAGALALIWTIGAYAVVFGIMLIILAFRLRTWAGAVQPPAEGPARG